MLNKKEFDYITSKVLKDAGFIKIENNCFIYELSEMYLMIIIVKSKFKDNIYIEYNLTVKALHHNLTLESIRNKDEYKDIMIQPRLVCISLENYSEEKYKQELEKLVKSHISHIRTKGLDIFKELEMNNFIIEKSVKDYLKLNQG